MLQITDKSSTIVVETMGGRLAFDAARGGQITEFSVKDDLFEHPVMVPDGGLAGFRFRVDRQPIQLEERHANMEVVARQADYARIRTRTDLHEGGLRLVQEYEIHEEGLLFSHLEIEVPSGRVLDIEEAMLSLTLDLTSTRRARWGRFHRDFTFKRDYTSLHALPKFHGNLDIEESFEAPELLPLVSLDLGWEGTRFYSNHLEFFIEDWAAIGDGPRTEQTVTRVGHDHGRWSLRWNLLRGMRRLPGPFRYRNRWGMAFGRARTASGAEADPAVRNNALGVKVCHLKVPYGQQGDRWPWISMPIKQVAEQDDQLFRANPPLSSVDEAADLGADLMIIHQFWMRNPGSNNEPVADYQPKDPKWLSDFTRRCHARGMRVMYYARGTEQWCHFSPFFEQFLQRNRDGLYLDWNTPFSMGAVRCSPLHVSLHNYFHFTKAVRERVGPGGLMIGHAGFSNFVSLACFDVLLGGETSVRHDELLSSPESSAYHSLLDCCGAHLIGGNMGDRSAFAGAKAGALCAALGMTSQVNMEPGTSFAKRVAFIKPLWDALGRLSGRIVRYHNPVFAPTRAVTTTAPTLYPGLWQADNGQALLLVTNLGTEAASGTVTVRFSEMDVPLRTPMQALSAPGLFTNLRAEAENITLHDIPPYRYAAVLIGKSERREGSSRTRPPTNPDQSTHS